MMGVTEENSVVDISSGFLELTPRKNMACLKQAWSGDIAQQARVVKPISNSRTEIGLSLPLSAFCLNTPSLDLTIAIV